MAEEKRPETRGHFIEPTLLVSQVENTAPFLFSETMASAAEDPKKNLGYVKLLNQFKTHPPLQKDLWSYFDLCLASHFATVGTFVPTDVDLSIRVKLWNGIHHENAFRPMWNRILEFHAWDESLVSKRFVVTPSGKKLSGHQGEWYTVAMGAYGASLKIAKAELMEVRETIEAEFKNQETALIELFDVFRETPSVPNMKALLIGVAAVAHNLGDLDRMFDAWEIAETDVLKRRVFRAGHEDARAPKEVFLRAGKIYKEMLATENHRHFALRDPKCLRRSSRFLLPSGPFFDQWGSDLVDESASDFLEEFEQREVAEALIVGWKKLNPLSIYTSQGYSRALAGMAMSYGKKANPTGTTTARLKAGREQLLRILPPTLKKDLIESGLWTLTAIPESEFDKKCLARLKTLI